MLGRTDPPPVPSEPIPPLPLAPPLPLPPPVSSTKTHLERTRDLHQRALVNGDRVGGLLEDFAAMDGALRLVVVRTPPEGRS